MLSTRPVFALSSFFLPNSFTLPLLRLMNYGRERASMAAPRAALAQSESKARFFERLGLQENNDYHRRVYAMMKEEAVQGRQRISASSRDVLVPRLRGDASVEPPYSNAQIDEFVIRREIYNIYVNASPETRIFYNFGNDGERAIEENWVIRWMLWHVFRYRDNRNRNRRANSPSPTRAGGGGVGGMATMQRSAAATTPMTVTANAYWDPVRSQWLPR